MNKKYYLLSLLNTMIVAMLSLGFTSCSKNNENEKDRNDNKSRSIGLFAHFIVPLR